MELVEGEDLSQRIARGAIPLDDAWPIAKQIADGRSVPFEVLIQPLNQIPSRFTVHRRERTLGMEWVPRSGRGHAGQVPRSFGKWSRPSQAPVPALSRPRRTEPAPNRRANTDVWIGARSDVPARRTLEDRIGDMPCRANAPKHVVEFVAQPQQGRHGQVVSPTQAQVLHHFREPDSMRVARSHGSSS